MRISRIIIKDSGPLRNVDLRFSPVTLIVGDNEKGKTSLINWIARGVFDNPDDEQGPSEWAQNIGGSHNVQIQAHPFPSYFDAQKMKHILFVREHDLLYKTQLLNISDETEYWDHEINRIFYGNDQISKILAQNLSHALGVQTESTMLWLDDLHEKLILLRSRIELIHNDLHLFYQQSQEIQDIKYRIAELDILEQEMNQEEERFFVMEKLSLGKHYLSYLENLSILDEKKKERNLLKINNEKIVQDLSLKENMLDKMENKISVLYTQVDGEQEKVSILQELPSDHFYPSVGLSIFQLVVGSSMIAVGLFLAFQSMKTVDLGVVKLLAMLFFGIGAILILVLWFKSLSMDQYDSEEEDDFFQEHLLQKTKKKFLRKYDQLEALKKRHRVLRDEVLSLKKNLEDNIVLKEKIEHDLESLDVNTDSSSLEEAVLKTFQTIDKKIIIRAIKKIETTLNKAKENISFEQIHDLRLEKIECKNRKSKAVQEYDRMYHAIWSTVQPALDAVKSSLDNRAIAQFYPEIQALTTGDEFLLLEDLFDKLNNIIQKIIQDKKKSEKIIKSMKIMQSSHQTLLVNTLHSPFFEYLVQNIFAGKYKKFRIEYEKGNRARIFADKGHKEFFPLESLSYATCSQFWLALRLTIAKNLLGNDLGIILLDNPFDSFDSLRKQVFVELLNAFVHQGWQVICTIGDDEDMKKMFDSMFGMSLSIFDLNKLSL